MPGRARPASAASSDPRWRTGPPQQFPNVSNEILEEPILRIVNIQIARRDQPRLTPIRRDPRSRRLHTNSLIAKQQGKGGQRRSRHRRGGAGRKLSQKDDRGRTRRSGNPSGSSSLPSRTPASTKPTAVATSWSAARFAIKESRTGRTSVNAIAIRCGGPNV